MIGTGPMGWSVIRNRHPDAIGTPSADRELVYNNVIADLREVNLQVNQAIQPRPDPRGLGDTWDISPAEGDCNDYAVTKRLELMQRGYPASCLLLAEVVEPAPSTEHHLVLVVPTERGRFVLDNLRSNIVKLERTGYTPYRIQCANDFDSWDFTVSV